MQIDRPDKPSNIHEVMMLRLKAKGLKWLKGFHLLAVSCWIGGGIALISLYFSKGQVVQGGVLYGINQAAHQIDTFVVVIPGAFGCLVTGLVYSSFSNWGFFRHKWLIFKWIVTISAILFGMFFLGPWETAMLEISGRLGLGALNHSAYLFNQTLNLVFGIVQVLVLALTVFVSIFKPWRTRK